MPLVRKGFWNRSRNGLLFELKSNEPCCCHSHKTLYRLWGIFLSAYASGSAQSKPILIRYSIKLSMSLVWKTSKQISSITGAIYLPPPPPTRLCDTWPSVAAFKDLNKNTIILIKQFWRPDSILRISVNLESVQNTSKWGLIMGPPPIPWPVPVPVPRPHPWDPGDWEDRLSWRRMPMSGDPGPCVVVCAVLSSGMSSTDVT